MNTAKTMLWLVAFALGTATPTVYAQGYGVDGSTFPGSTFGSIPLAEGATYTPVGLTEANRQGGDFGPGDTFYTMQDGNLVSVSMSDGGTTVIGPVTGVSPGHTTIGMAYDIRGGTMYLASTNVGTGESNIYTLSLGSGAATLVGTVTNAVGLLAIAANCSGRLYGIDAINDNLVRIDPANAEGKVVGPLGTGAPFVAQDADFEAKTGRFYWTFWNGSEGELHQIDPASGETKLVTTFPQDFISFGIRGSTCPTMGYIDFGATGSGALGDPSTPFSTISEALTAFAGKNSTGLIELRIKPGAYGEHVVLTEANGETILINTWNGEAGDDEVVGVDEALEIDSLTIGSAGGLAQGRIAGNNGFGQASRQGPEVLIPAKIITGYSRFLAQPIIEHGDLVVNGDFIQSGEFRGKATVVGKTSIDGLFIGDLYAGGDVIIGSGSNLADADIIFNGFRQYLEFTRNLSVHSFTMNQVQGGQGEIPYLKLKGQGSVFQTGGITLKSGVVVNEEDDLRVPAGGIQLIGPDSTSGFIDGCLSQTTGAALNAFSFPLGSFNKEANTVQNRSVGVTFNEAPISGGTTTVCPVDERPGSTKGFPIGPITGPADFYWLVTSDVGFGANQTFDLEFLGSGFTDFTDVEDIRMIRRLDGDVTNTWQEQGGTYDNFLTTPENDPTVRVTDTKGGLTSQGSLFTFGLTDLSFAQVIHNVPDAGPVDVYVDDTKVVDDLSFQGGSYLLLPDSLSGKWEGGNVLFRIAVAPGTSSSVADSIASMTLDVEAGQGRVVSLLDDGDGGISLSVSEDARAAGSDPNAVDLKVLHAVPDAAAVDLRISPNAGGTPLLLSNVAFGGETAYETVASGTYILELLVTGTSTQIAAAQIDLTGYEGKAVTAIASGHVDAQASEPFSVILFALGEEIRTGVVVTDTEEDVDLPEQFTVLGNYPNPFSTQTTFAFTLDAPGPVQLVVYDLTGKKIATVLDEARLSGHHTVSWQPQGLSSGVYYYRLLAGNSVETRKMVMLK